jgi:hypothetical protein
MPSRASDDPLQAKRGGKSNANFVFLWRCGVVGFALVAAAQIAIEVFHAPRVLEAGVVGATLFKGGFLRERGPTTFVVDSLPDDSPLREAGVVAGDRLQWDAPVGRWYNVAAGERVALTVIHGGASRRIEVTAPAARNLSRYSVASYVMDIAGRIAALLIGLLFGWRRPDLATFRGIAAAGLLAANGFPFSAPAAAHIGWLDFIASASPELVPGAIVFFALNYPDDRPVGWRAIMKRFYPWFYGLQIATAIVFYALLYSGLFEPSGSWIFRPSLFILPILFFWSIVLAWRQSRGESRVRLQWILATIGTIVVVNLVGTLNSLAGNPISADLIGVVLNGAILAAEAGFVYAVLRRRIFDFGLAVNRTLVFGIVGAILLGVFQVAHGIVSEFLHFDDKNKTILLSAVLAVAVYLSFNQLKKQVEKLVDRIFFNSWAAAEQDLRRFVEEAKHATDAGSLSTLLVAAIDRFAGGAGCALYRRDESGPYARGESTLTDAPAHIAANDETVLKMLAHREAVTVRQSAAREKAAKPALGLPMAHRGELLGFVLLGARTDGEPYRPDQVSVLELAAHEVGLDFYALRLNQLADQVAAERRTSETLRAQLQTAMALAKSAPLPNRN